MVNVRLDIKMADTDTIRTEFSNLSAFQRDILFIIAEIGPSKGLRIKSELQDLYGEEVNHGRLYPNLDQLVEGGFIDKAERDKRTNEYSLTDDGREAMDVFIDWQQACRNADEASGDQEADTAAA
jgi:DNA-binding PadR family transcriptional regulator